VAISMLEREACTGFLYDLGWRLLRGHPVCPDCMKKKRVSIPRRAE
jgi:hypothetical protein